MTSPRVLLLRLDAPLMSFGGIAVDEQGVTGPFPTQSMLTGLLANALGYMHGDADRLQRLQERLQFAARRDRKGRRLIDFHTVDLGQAFMKGTWTTRGRPARREGGSASIGTHIRYRQYWADAVFTVALTLKPVSESPSLDECARALESPERPLFIGRKPCLPAARLFIGIVSAVNLRAAIVAAPLSERAEAEAGSFAACWTPIDPPSGSSHDGILVPVFDRRDWRNQVHTGRRLMWQSQISMEEVTHAAE